MQCLGKESVISLVDLHIVANIGRLSWEAVGVDLTQSLVCDGVVPAESSLLISNKSEAHGGRRKNWTV